jgi:hypothetical protein
MKWLFILLLLANVLYFGWELDRQTKFDFSLKSPTNDLPNQAIALKFLSELAEKPPLRVSEPENFQTTVFDSDYEARAEPEPGDFGKQTDDIPDVDLNTQLLDFDAIEETATLESHNPLMN